MRFLRHTRFQLFRSILFAVGRGAHSLFLPKVAIYVLEAGMSQGRRNLRYWHICFYQHHGKLVDVDTFNFLEHWATEGSAKAPFQTTAGHRNHIHYVSNPDYVRSMLTDESYCLGYITVFSIKKGILWSYYQGFRIVSLPDEGFAKIDGDTKWTGKGDSLW